MNEREALRNVAGKAMNLIQRWSETDEAGHVCLLKELGTALHALEAAEVAAGTWEETHG